MSLQNVSRILLAAVLFAAAAATARADFVTIGNPGNAMASALNTSHGQSGAYDYGAVPYTYQISETAVSIFDWSAFYGNGTIGVAGGIGGGTAVGSFNSTYNHWNNSPRTVGLNAPAVNISFHQVAQYVNWLTSGNATQGAYTINGTTGHVTSIMSRADILAAAEATGKPYFLIPTEDEWYKAAYYTGSGYTLYAHGLDTVPLKSSNANRSVGWVYDKAFTGSDLVRPVGMGPGEQNGTLNMMGNVWEWNEAIIDSKRGLRGGSYSSLELNLRASSRNPYIPDGSEPPSRVPRSKYYS